MLDQLARRLVYAKNKQHGWLKCIHVLAPLIARFMGTTWGPSGADRTQVGPILTPWTLLSGSSCGVLLNINDFHFTSFLAATKQLNDWFSPSVCLSVCLWHLFDYVPIIISSWNFQKLLPMTNVTFMQKVKVRGQRSRSQRSRPNLTVSGL